MYIPKHFRVTDEIIIEQFIKENGFATLISMGADHPIGTHIPVELEINSKGEKVLWGHISRANLQWMEFERFPNVLIIFLSGIHHYISSSWYNHPNAPTWNYLSVHITGKIKLLEGDELWESVRRLTNRYEKYSKNPVSLDNLPIGIQKQMKSIVGFEVSIDKTDAAFKISQNRNKEDFGNIIKELRLSTSSVAKIMANIMEQSRSKAYRQDEQL